MAVNVLKEKIIICASYNWFREFLLRINIHNLHRTLTKNFAQALRMSSAFWLSKYNHYNTYARSSLYRRRITLHKPFSASRRQYSRRVYYSIAKVMRRDWNIYPSRSRFSGNDFMSSLKFYTIQLRIASQLIVFDNTIDLLRYSHNARDPFGSTGGHSTDRCTIQEL